MSETLANTIIGIGMGIGGLVWFAAMRCLRKMASIPERTLYSSLLPQPLEVAQHALLRAALQGSPPFSVGVHVLEDQPGMLKFQLMGGSTVSFQLERTFHGTKVQAWIDRVKPRKTYLWVMTMLVTVAMPLAVLGIGWVLLRFVATNGEPAMRWQAVQILQIAHVLWPPFLVGKLFQSRVQLAEGFVRNTLARAKLTDDVTAA